MFTGLFKWDNPEYTNLFRTDGKTVQQGAITVTNPEDEMVASINCKKLMVNMSSHTY